LSIGQILFLVYSPLVILFQDLRYAVRMLRKDSAFTLVAILSLALGTGANATMFSLVNGMLLRPLAVARPGEVLTIAQKQPDNYFDDLSYPDYIDFRDRTETMKDLVASALFRFGFSHSPDALPQVKYGLLVSGNLFHAMGVTPVLGRAFRPDEDQVPGRDAVVVLGHDFWRDEFGSDPHVIGRVVRLNGLDFTVIGVAPETFTGMDEFFKVAMFVPAMMASRLATDANNSLLTRRDWRNFMVRGRLKAGFDASQAEGELVSIAKGLEETYPGTNSGKSVVLRTETQMHIQHMPQESGLMMMAMIMAGLVLLISCFNVANLLLSRGRTREIAVRLAMGSGRARLIRQLLTESLLLGIAGTVAGVWFAWGAAHLFNRIKLPSDLPFMIDIRSDHRVLLFSLSVGLLSVLFFGLAPALQSSKLDLVSALKSTDAAIVSGRNQGWVRNLLVIAQIAISVVILLAATMVYNGFNRQLSGSPGLRTSHVLMMSFDPRVIRYNQEQAEQFYRRLLDQAGSAPGVKSVAMGATMPLAIAQRGFSIDVTREGEQRSKNNEKDHILYDMVDEHFFDTMAVRIVRGRGFRASDTADAPPVVVVNEVLSAKYWPGEDAIGKRIQIEADDRQIRWLEVVGVAQTSRYVWLTEAPTDYLYLPMAQNFRLQRTLFVESYGDAASLTGRMREVIRGLDSNMPVYDVRTIEEYFGAAVVGTANVTISIVGSMALTGLILSMIGLYGLIAYSVSRRTREFGIRMAIGAGKASVLRMVLFRGALLCFAGNIAGIAVSLPATRLLQSLVFSANSDWTPYVVVPLLLMLVTLAAIYGPARRAAMIDPVKALRDE
jgi:putative ABC transport system permease protein